MQPARRVVVAAIVRSLVRSLVLTGISIGVSLLIWQVSPPAASLTMLLFTGWMLLRSYRAEWTLSWLPCLLPAATALACFVAQLAVLEQAPVVGLVPPALLGGLAVGALAGRAHRVFVRGQQVVARRTSLYLVVWFVCFALTQAAALFGMSSAVPAALSGGVFSTTMVVVMSLVLFARYRSQHRRLRLAPAAAAVALLIAAFGTASAMSATQQAPQISTPEVLPEGRIATFYSQTLTATGGFASSQWLIAAGALPEGLTLDPTSGVIAGTPAAAVTARFRVRVSDSQGWTEKEFSLNVRGVPEQRGAAGATAVTPGGLDAFDIANRLILPSELPRDFVMLPLTRPEAKARAAQHLAQNYGPAVRQYNLPEPDDMGLLMAEPNRFRVGFGVFALALHRYADPTTARRAIDAFMAAGAAEPDPGVQLSTNTLPCGDQSASVSFRGEGPNVDFVASGRWLGQLILFLPDSFFVADPSDLADPQKKAAAEAARERESLPLRERYACLVVERLKEFAQAPPGGLPVLQLEQRFRDLVGSQPGGSELTEAAVEAGWLAALILLFSGVTVNLALSAGAAVAAASAASAAAAADAAAAEAAVAATASATTTDPHADDDLAEERREREASSRRFWEENRPGPDAEERQRAERRARDGYLNWDDDQGAWVRPAGWRSPEELRLDEYYRRGDWIADHASGLGDGQQQVADRLFDRMDYQDHGVSASDVSDQDLSALRRMTHAMGNTFSGASEAQGADADRDAANLELGEVVASDMAQIGQLAATNLEGRFIPGTGGAISAFIFGAASSWDQGLGGAVKNGAISGATSLADARIGGARRDSFTWNAMSGALTSAAAAGLQGGGVADMAEAAAEGGLWGATGPLQQRISGEGGRLTGRAAAPGGRTRPGSRSPGDGMEASLRPGARPAEGAHRSPRDRVLKAHEDLAAATTAAGQARDVATSSREALNLATKEHDKALSRVRENPSKENQESLDGWADKVQRGVRADARDQAASQLADRREALSRQALERAKDDYFRADPRRDLRTAQDEMSVTERRVRDAAAEVDKTRRARESAERAIQASPRDPDAIRALQVAERRSAAAGQVLDDAYASRVKAGEHVREAAVRMQDHLQTEYTARLQIDWTIRDTFGLSSTATTEFPGQLRITDDRELFEQHRVRNYGLPGDEALELPRRDILGFNQWTTSRTLPNDPATAIHERLHAASDLRWRQISRDQVRLNEGLTEHFTARVLEHQTAGGPTGPPSESYGAERATVAKLEKVVGEQSLRGAYFKGETAALREKVGQSLGILDAKAAQAEGARALDLVERAMAQQRHQDANHVLELMSQGRASDARAAITALEASLPPKG